MTFSYSPVYAAWEDWPSTDTPITAAALQGVDDYLGQNVGPVFNVCGFGAVGDGSTDDTDAIQDAIDAADAVGGGAIWIPPTTGGFIVSQIRMKDRTQLLGSGRRSVLVCKANNAEDSMITLDSTSENSVIIRNLRLNGNKDNQSGEVTAILFQGGSGNPVHVVEQVDIQGFTGRGIDWQPGCLVTRAIHNTLFDCDLEGIYVGAGDSILVGNVIGQCGLEGISVNAFNVKTAYNKPWECGQVTSSRGVGILVSSIANNFMSVLDEPQDNLDDGFYLNGCDKAQIIAGSPNNNVGAGFHLDGVTYCRVEGHCGGGERNDQSVAVEFSNSPANNFVDVTYDPTTVTSVTTGTIPASNQVWLNKVKYMGPNEFVEISDPSAPAANRVLLYARDTGGKTELVARFPTGAVQQVAIEP